MHIKLKNLNKFTDRHGRRRVYLRVPGCKAVELKSEPGSPAFMAEYNAALASLPVQAVAAAGAKKGQKKAEAPHDRTFARLAREYYATDFKKIPGEGTRKNVSGIIDRFVAQYGNRHAGLMSYHDINKIHSDMAETPAAANNMLTQVSKLMKLAKVLRWRADDPTEDVKRFETGNHHTWEADEVAAFRKRWAIGTPEYTVFALLHETTQRIGDVAKMKWSDYDAAEGLILVQQKKGRDEKKDRRLWVAVSRPLAEALDAWRETLRSGERKVSSVATGGTPIIITQYGLEFSPGGLSSWFADKIEAAGLPERCVAHGLRKSGLVDMAERGATAKEMQAMSGHKNLKELELYTDRANQKKLARAAVRKRQAEPQEGED